MTDPAAPPPETDDHDSAPRIAVREVATAQQRNLEHVEVPGEIDLSSPAVRPDALDRPADDLRTAGRSRLRAARSTWRSRASTPGSARTRSRPAGSADRRPRPSRTCGSVSDIRIVRTLCDTNPGFTARSAMNDRISSDAPTSSTSASATSATTRIDRALFCRNPLPDRPPLSFSVRFRSTRTPERQARDPRARPPAREQAEHQTGRQRDRIEARRASRR